ncbi:unnamed protein product, partial [Pylaiella littoralis]
MPVFWSYDSHGISIFSILFFYLVRFDGSFNSCNISRVLSSAKCAWHLKCSWHLILLLNMCVSTFFCRRVVRLDIPGVLSILSDFGVMPKQEVFPRTAVNRSLVKQSVTKKNVPYWTSQYG